MITVQDPEARRQHALDLAYRYLAQRDRTVLEVRRHLERKRIEPDAIDAALAELGRQEYLDDARYARLFAEDRRRLDGWGVERIERRLTVLGVPATTIAAVLGERAADDELRAALEILRRKLPTPPSDDRGRERALGLLVRRGYDMEVAYDAVRAFERGEEPEDAGDGGGGQAPALPRDATGTTMGEREDRPPHGGE